MVLGAVILLLFVILDVRDRWRLLLQLDECQAQLEYETKVCDARVEGAACP